MIEPQMKLDTDTRTERWRLNRIARTNLAERQESLVFRLRSSLASLILGKDNWQAIFHNIVGMVCADPGAGERLLRKHLDETVDN